MLLFDNLPLFLSQKGTFYKPFEQFFPKARRYQEKSAIQPRGFTPTIRKGTKIWLILKKCAFIGVAEI